MKDSALSALRAAIETLGQGASDVEDVRGTLDTWRALIDGRCSLVQSFDADGHRFLVARRNPAGARPASGLSALEAQALLLRARSSSYKVMAEELQLSIAAAHGLVRAGMTKLGVRDESELPGLFGCHDASCSVPTE